MHFTQSNLLFPAASVLEIIGISTLITNDGMLISDANIGFSVPAILPVEVQGIGLLIAGAALTGYAVLNMN